MMRVNAYLEGAVVERIVSATSSHNLLEQDPRFLPALHEISGVAHVVFADGDTCLIDIDTDRVQALGRLHQSTEGEFTFEELGRFLYAVAEYAADEICAVYPKARRKSFELPYRFQKSA